MTFLFAAITSNIFLVALLRSRYYRRRGRARTSFQFQFIRGCRRLDRLLCNVIILGELLKFENIRWLTNCTTHIGIESFENVVALYYEFLNACTRQERGDSSLK